MLKVNSYIIRFIVVANCGGSVAENCTYFESNGGEIGEILLSYLHIMYFFLNSILKIQYQSNNFVNLISFQEHAVLKFVHALPISARYELTA